jgi:hypothetical protein
MRVRHVEQALLGLRALEPVHLGLLERAQADGERLRHLLWNGQHQQACEALGRIVSRAVVPGNYDERSATTTMSARRRGGGWA